MWLLIITLFLNAMAGAVSEGERVGQSFSSYLKGNISSFSSALSGSSSLTTESGKTFSAGVSLRSNSAGYIKLLVLNFLNK